MQISALDARHTPLDILMDDIAKDYRAGLIGIAGDGTLMNLADIYHDLKRSNPQTDYHIAAPREIDREYQRQHKPCTTAYRTTEQKETEQGICPYCHKTTDSTASVLRLVPLKADRA